MSHWRVTWLLSSTWVNWKRSSPIWTKWTYVDDETASRQTQLLLLLFVTISEWSVQEWQCSGGMCMTGPNPRKLTRSLPVALPCSLVLDLCLFFQDFTSSQSWSVESSTSDSPTSMAIINEISESLLTAGSCSSVRVEKTGKGHYGHVFLSTCYCFSVLQMGPRSFPTIEVVLRFQTLLLFNVHLKHLKKYRKVQAISSEKHDDKEPGWVTLSFAPNLPRALHPCPSSPWPSSHNPSTSLPIPFHFLNVASSFSPHKGSKLGTKSQAPGGASWPSGKHF